MLILPIILYIMNNLKQTLDILSVFYIICSNLSVTIIFLIFNCIMIVIFTFNIGV